MIISMTKSMSYNKASANDGLLDSLFNIARDP